MLRCYLPLFCLFTLGIHAPSAATGILKDVQHHYTENAVDGTKIHYVSNGAGPLVVFVHGFPDFWHSWAHQMETLSATHRCVAVDLRGYNLSGKPKDQKSYRMDLLIADIEAVIKSCGAKHAVVVGHDWGGAISWTFALTHPELVDKLVICNLPHLRGLKRELLINDDHRRNTQYARDFQDPDYQDKLSPRILTATLGSMRKRPMTDTEQLRYVEAFGKSDIRAMLDYYRANYNPVLQDKAPLPYVDDSPLVKAKMPVLMFHGLQDTALHHHALNNTWEWVERDLTIVTLPNAGHWVHHDEPEFVSSTIQDWLQRRRED